MKTIKYLCPVCWKLSGKINVSYKTNVLVYFEEGCAIDEDVLESYTTKIEFECGHETSNYIIDAIEVVIDDENKTVEMIRKFEEYEDEIRKANEEIKDYRFMWIVEV